MTRTSEPSEFDLLNSAAIERSEKFSEMSETQEST